MFSFSSCYFFLCVCVCALIPKCSALLCDPSNLSSLQQLSETHRVFLTFWIFPHSHASPWSCTQLLIGTSQKQCLDPRAASFQKPPSVSTRKRRQQKKTRCCSLAPFLIGLFCMPLMHVSHGLEFSWLKCIYSQRSCERIAPTIRDRLSLCLVPRHEDKIERHNPYD